MMTKQVIRDYFAAFRWGKVKEYYKTGGWSLFITMTATMPLFLRYLHTPADGLNYFFTLIPLEFVLFAAPLHPMELPKIMYLCPLSEEERREYITKSFWFKLALPLVPGIFFMSILLLLGITDFFQVGMVLLEMILIGLVFGLDGRGAFMGENGYQKPVIKELENWQPIAGMVGMLMACFVAFLPVAGGRETWETILVLCLIFLLQLPLTIKVMWYYRRVVEHALNYERIERQKR